ncbi:hypothetical protein LOC68_27190 [Blastopirellula sp. JC732]|uniref:BBP7 family outer membrane beta-barrel protein n=1 Tax=Blastopirellula sediminis TaxID=2894196 RepID=A0A9X1SJK7_9BACT|nr:hypothetical protein [Blastopirellula sediminis]MCC9604605.1 hypothetical protein [Blastopirellula sediminis]MCC9632096.1 hypothetical protein [Blastopirellula sediminis]
MRAHSLWIVSLMAMLAASTDAVAQKATYATGSDQHDSAGQPSGIAYLASGQWRQPLVSDPPSQGGSGQNAQPGQYPQANPYQPTMMTGGMMPQPGMGYPGMMPQPGMGYPGMMPYGAAPAAYAQPNPMIQQDPSVVEASYHNGTCAACGGHGCATCRGSGCGCCGNGCQGCCGLFGGGQYCGFSRGIGNAWDLSEYGGRCAPRYFDFSAEATLFKLEGNVPSRAFASSGVLGPTVLDSNQLGFETEGGIRMTGNWICFAGSTLEVSYMGVGNWGSGAFVTGAGDLYSPLSNFGSDPLGGYAESDQSDFVGLSLNNRFDSIEINLKRGWTGAGCWFQGSWWGGFRYFRLSERSNYVAIGATGAMDYSVDTDNDMYGVQLGGDLTTRLTTRLSLTGFLECGLYGNRGVQHSTILLNDGGTVAGVFEEASANRASMVTEGGFHGNFKLTPHATLKLGYQVVYVDGVALSIDNYNFTTALGTGPAALVGRSISIDDNGSALYHGATAGLECVW